MSTTPITLLKSGQLADQAGVHVESLRYYEREGLLPEPRRSESGYRLYTTADLQRVRFIKKAQQLGFSLKEIAELLSLKQQSDRSAAEVNRLTRQKVAEIDAKLAELTSIKSALLTLLDQCPGEAGTVECCPILDCFTNEGG